MYIHIYFLFSCFSHVSLLLLLKSTAEIHYQCPALFNSNKPRDVMDECGENKKSTKFIYSTHAELISHVNCIFLSFSWDFLALSSHFNTFFFSQSPRKKKEYTTTTTKKKYWVYIWSHSAVCIDYNQRHFHLTARKSHTKKKSFWWQWKKYT